MKLIWGGLLRSLECLLALLFLGGCTAGLSSIGIGPLVFIIIAIVRLLGSKSLGERAKLWNTVLTASTLGAIAHVVFAFAITSLAQRISGTMVLSSSDTPDSVEVLMFAGPVLISALIGAFVAYRSRGRNVPTAKAAVLATYIALGLEGLFYILALAGDTRHQNEALGIGWVTFLFSSLMQLIAAGLGAAIFSLLVSFLTRRHHHELAAATARSETIEEASAELQPDRMPRLPLFFTTGQWLMLALLGIAVLVVLGCLISIVGAGIASQ